MDVRKLAKAYEKQLRPNWDDRFVPFLLESFPEELPPKATLLEMGCATGRLTTEIVRRLPEGGRLIAVEDIRELMEIARLKVAEADRKQVFFKKERPDSLSFADGTFDGVVSGGLATAYHLNSVLNEAARLLKKDGFLLLGTVLQGSFQELLDIFREVLEKEDLIPVQEELDQICQRLPDRLAAKRLLANVGIVDNIVRIQEETVHFDNGLEFVIAPLIRQHCLDECLGLIKDRGWREGVLAGMIRALDTYFPDGIDLTLIMGRLEGNKL
ncbi:MAG: methyltransferase domain-containing protein [Deltaproteobacteria bacterium]|nr:methyltransferase domain-containing protein [Deltaproteobacteria bacterium]